MVCRLSLTNFSIAWLIFEMNSKLRYLADLQSCSDQFSIIDTGNLRAESVCCVLLRLVLLWNVCTSIVPLYDWFGNFDHQRQIRVKWQRGDEEMLGQSRAEAEQSIVRQE